MDKVEYVSCIKCGSNNIVFNDYGYTSFNVAFGKCKDCKNEVILSPYLWDDKKIKIINEWNKFNDPNILREKYQTQINELQILINNLPK